MVESKSTSLVETFQKWFPLRIASVSDIPHPAMMANCIDFSVDELALLAKGMISLCRKEQGVGLAAVQCGIPLNIFVASADSLNFRCFFDVDYESDEEKQDSLESCLSLYDKNRKLRRFMVKRFGNARFHGKELFFNNSPASVAEINEDLSGLFAVVCQHEADHGKGILISDHGKEVEVLY